MIKPILKFRPSLTSDMIKEIYTSLQNGETKDYIRNYILKIDNNLIQPNYVNTGLRNSTINNLGFTPEEANQNIEPVKIDFVSKRTELYNKWLQDPLSITSDELDFVLDYRLENGLMSPDEEADYLNKLMGG